MLITTMFSAEGESVDLIPHMYPKGNVEVWLGKVSRSQRTPGLAFLCMVPGWKVPCLPQSRLGPNA